jgi:hypothetical protein
MRDSSATPSHYAIYMPFNLTLLRFVTLALQQFDNFIRMVQNAITGSQCPHIWEHIWWQRLQVVEVISVFTNMPVTVQDRVQGCDGLSIDYYERPENKWKIL